MSRRVLFGTFGSAGDLFPLVPLMQRLMSEGHEVRCATTRSLGLYLRAIGVPTIALGDGTEVRVVDDEEIFTNADDGWASWRRTVEGYILPTVDADVDVLRRVVAGWRPDVAATTSLALPVRLAMHLEGVPVVDVTIYPQHDAAAAAMADTPDHPLVAMAGRARPDLPAETVAWGVPADVLLHDPVLLGSAAEAPVGFPYWDDLPCHARDLEAVDAWAATGRRRLLVTLGSFIGVARRDVWFAAADAAAAHDLHVAFVGARGSWAEEAFADDDRVSCIGFVPLSRCIPHASVVVHHGGIGTTFAAVRAARPALVVPQAFDQSANGRMIEAAGLGVVGVEGRLADQLADLLDDDDRRAGVELARSRLISTDDATTAAVAALTPA